MADKPEAVLLATHVLNARIVSQYRRLAAEAGAGREAMILYNRGDDPAPGYLPPDDVRSFAFDAQDMRLLGFPRKGRRPDARDVELFALVFHRRHPWYERLWVVEYDVAFTGRWRTLFDAFDASGADLLATTVHRHAATPGWENWESVRQPEGGRPPPEDLVRAFMPCYRISRRALETLEEAYRAGWCGHYEATVPTVLDQAGLVLEDIGGDGAFVAPGNRNRFYTNTPSLNDLSPGTFVFRPVRTEPGPEPDMLWHPVKPPSIGGGWATGRRAALTRWAQSWAARVGADRLARLRR